MLRRFMLLSAFVVATGTLVVGTPVHASSAPVTGSVSCVVAGQLWSLPKISNTPSTHSLGLHINRQGFVSLSCDDSGVHGTHISSIGLSLAGTWARGSTCNSIVSDPKIGTTKGTVRWQDVNPGGKVRSVAASHFFIASASYDTPSYSLILVTKPLSGAFAGETMTFRLGISQSFGGDGSGFPEDCDTTPSLGPGFGDSGVHGDHPATISVP